ncbi:MAG: hypothetical protein LJF04_08165, partial [Gemmatimonadetes bacterium]|nr:hypothetical protein [Gemmatimonadota bacterium]
CVFKIAKDVLGSGPSSLAGLGVAPMVVGIAVATVAAALSVRWLVSYLNRHGLAVFGWYRLGLSAAFVVLVLGGWLSFGKRPPSTPSASTTSVAIVR